MGRVYVDKTHARARSGKARKQETDSDRWRPVQAVCAQMASSPSRMHTIDAELVQFRPDSVQFRPAVVEFRPHVGQFTSIASHSSSGDCDLAGNQRGPDVESQTNGQPVYEQMHRSNSAKGET